MAIIKLTDLNNDSSPLYLNSDHIVAVQRVGKDTWVTTTTINDQGSGRIYAVAQVPEQVVDLINNV